MGAEPCQNDINDDKNVSSSYSLASSSDVNIFIAHQTTYCWRQVCVFDALWERAMQCEYAVNPFGVFHEHRIGNIDMRDFTTWKNSNNELDKHQTGMTQVPSSIPTWGDILLLGFCCIRISQPYLWFVYSKVYWIKTLNYCWSSSGVFILYCSLL